MYDSINHTAVPQAMEELAIPDHLISIVNASKNPVRCHVKIDRQASRTFEMRNGLRQGDALSSLLFNIVSEKAIQYTRHNRL